MFPAEECDCPSKYEYSYDQAGKLTMSYSYDYDWDHNRWVFKTRNQNQFDSYGNTVGYTGDRWSREKSDWIPDFGQEFGYDDAGRKTLELVYFWDQVKNAWNPYQKEEFAYNQRGQQNFYLWYKWDKDRKDWRNLQKEEWTRDSLGKENIYTHFSWVQVNSEYIWKEDERKKTESLLDSAGKAILATRYNWEPVHKTWTRYEQLRFGYDEYGNKIHEVTYHWSVGKNDWLGNDSAEWAYDWEGHMIMQARDNRSSGDLADLNRFGKAERKFDADGDQTLEIHYWWDRNLKTFYSGTKDYFYYHSAITGIQEKIAGNIHVFPNPTSGLLNLTSLTLPAEAKIHSLQGMLLRRIIQVESRLDISDLPAGMYILNISNGSQIRSKTLIIKE